MQRSYVPSATGRSPALRVWPRAAIGEEVCVQAGKNLELLRLIQRDVDVADVAQEGRPGIIWPGEIMVRGKEVPYGEESGELLVWGVCSERWGDILPGPEQAPLHFCKGLGEPAAIHWRIALGVKTQFERLPPVQCARTRSGSTMSR